MHNEFKCQDKRDRLERHQEKGLAIIATVQYMEIQKDIQVESDYRFSLVIEYDLKPLLKNLIY